MKKWFSIIKKIVAAAVIIVLIAFVDFAISVYDYERYWGQHWIHEFDIRKKFCKNNVITNKKFSITIPEKFHLSSGYKNTEVCILQYPDPRNRRSYSYGFNKKILPMPYRTNGITFTILPHNITSDSINCWMGQKVAEACILNTGATDTIMIDSCRFIGRKSKICDLKIKKNYYKNDSFGSYFNNEKGIWIEFWGLSEKSIDKIFNVKIR